MGQGPQDNESAIEQAKDEQISDYSEYPSLHKGQQKPRETADILTNMFRAVRKQYKSTTGSDVPIKDKETRFG